MAEKKVGVLVKEARTAAKLTQESLARLAGANLTAGDISRCERGEADLTLAQLKKIASVCGVTQASLVNAPKNLSKTASKTTSVKTAATKKTGSTVKTSTAKATAAKGTASAGTSMKLTAAEKKLIEAYRSASSDRKKAALKLLNGEYGEAIDKILSVTGGAAASSSSSTSVPDAIGDLMGNLLGGLLGGK